MHTGRACVFEDIDDYHKRIDDEDLDVDENSVLVLKNCGLRGYPGMSEVSVLVYILLVLETSYHTVRENIVCFRSALWIDDFISQMRKSSSIISRSATMLCQRRY